MTLKRWILNRAEWLGHMFFYGVLLACGQRVAYLFLYPVLLVYVLCSRKIHRNLHPYLSRRFPEHDRFQLLLDGYRCVLEFGKVLIDRAWIGLKNDSRLTGRLENSEQLREAIAGGRGIVALLAHVGNWQTSFVDLGRLDTQVYSLMEYDPDQVAKHFFDLNREKTFSIIDTGGFMGGMVEAATVLQRGAMVLTMADRYAGGPTATVEFMGAPLRVPLAPYSLAASTGSLILVLLSAKTGRTTYELKIWDVIDPAGHGRPEREILTQHAKRFSTALEEYVKLYPYQWFNFFDIWKQ